MLSVRDIDKDVDNMEADLKSEFEIPQARVDARISFWKKSVSELRINEKLLEKDIEYEKQKQRLAYEAHEDQLLRLVARNTRDMENISHNTRLNYHFNKLAH